ncbi:aldo-keto reductase family 1 member C15-like [Diceros bicornis minor]|uniref:aldo-keto reductase family 1 member C15-like n=1 Tax=Diceros bicornis minor TaxID=77932 RepID=UPI0026E9EC13|nr:aldo-keto reductase family 1 member C15-like [Diceros bicornis minor]
MPDFQSHTVYKETFQIGDELECVAPDQGPGLLEESSVLVNLVLLISGFQTFNVKSRAKLHEKFTSHFPPPESLEKCTDGSLTTSIGVSNFNHTQLEMILNKPEFKYKLISNQVECHPYLNQRNLLEFCKCKDVVVVAYSALGSCRDPNWVESDSPYLLEEPILNSIAKKHNQNPGWVTDCYQQLWGDGLMLS